MANEQQLTQVLAAIEADLTGYIAASVVDLDSGMTLATHSRRPEFDLTLASAYNSEMVKAKIKTLEVLKLQTKLEDMLLTLGDQIHLIRLVSDSTFLYLAAERTSTEPRLGPGHGLKVRASDQYLN